MRVTGRRAVATCIVAILALAPVPALALDEPFYIALVARIMIFAIAAMSLDLILGYGGLVSFGHAVFLCIGGCARGDLGFFRLGGGSWHFVRDIALSGIAPAGALGG